MVFLNQIPVTQPYSGLLGIDFPVWI